MICIFYFDGLSFKSGYQTYNNKNDLLKIYYMEFTLSQQLFFPLANIIASGTLFLLGYNRDVLPYWAYGSMIILMLYRAKSYYNTKNLHYFTEMCYYINILTAYFVSTNMSIESMYPFVHGTMLLTGLLQGDLFAPHSATRTTTYYLHYQSMLITFGIRWNSQFINQSIFSDWSDGLTFDLKYAYYQTYDSLIYYYLYWAILYTLYLYLLHNGDNNLYQDTITQYKPLMQIPKILRPIAYIIIHVIIGSLMMFIGALSYNSFTLDRILLLSMLLSGLIRGGFFYRTRKPRI